MRRRSDVVALWPAAGCVNESVMYPTLLVHWEMLAEAKFVVVRPETVRALEESMRPEPRSEVKYEPLMMRAPTEWEPVVVALPTMVDDAVARKPPDKVSCEVVADIPVAG